MASKAGGKQQAKPLTLKDNYLIFYNAASAGAWAYLLALALNHLVHPPAPISLLPHESTGLFTRLKAISSSGYASFGWQVTLVQTAAIFDVLHVVLGLVRSKVGTTAAQVASRLVLVWGILCLFPQTQTSPFFLPMVFAWCIAEIVRYTNYAAAILGISLPFLETIRYNMFYILYPVGAGSEDMHMWAAVPSVRAAYGPFAQWFLIFLAGLVWPVSLHVLMTYMASQRRKHMRKSKSG